MDDKIIKDIKQAILDMLPWCEDVLNAMQDIVDAAFESAAQRDRERMKWRQFNAPRIRLLLLDKRSKVHRCRNAC